MWVKVDQVNSDTIKFSATGKLRTIERNKTDLKGNHDHLESGDYAILSGESMETISKNRMLNYIRNSSSSISTFTDDIKELMNGGGEANEVETLIELLESNDFQIRAFDDNNDLLRCIFESPETQIVLSKGKQKHGGSVLVTQFLRAYAEEDGNPPIDVNKLLNSLLKSIKYGNKDKNNIGNVLIGIGKSYRKKYPFRTDYDESLLEDNVDTKIAALINNGFSHKDIGNLETVWGEIILKHYEHYPKTINALINCIPNSNYSLTIAEFLAELYEEHSESIEYSENLKNSVLSLKDDYTLNENRLKDALTKIDKTTDFYNEPLRDKDDVKKNVEYLKTSSPGDINLGLENPQLGMSNNHVDEVFMRLATLSNEYPVVVGAQIPGLVSYHKQTPQPLYMSEIMYNYSKKKPTELPQHIVILVGIIMKTVKGDAECIAFKNAIKTIDTIIDVDPSVVVPHIEKLYTLGNNLEEINPNVNNGHWPESGCNPYEEIENVILKVQDALPNEVEEELGKSVTAPVFDYTPSNSSPNSNAGILSNVKERFR